MGSSRLASNHCSPQPTTRCRNLTAGDPSTDDELPAWVAGQRMSALHRCEWKCVTRFETKACVFRFRGGLEDGKFGWCRSIFYADQLFLEPCVCALCCERGENRISGQYPSPDADHLSCSSPRRRMTLASPLPTGLPPMIPCPRIRFCSLTSFDSVKASGGTDNLADHNEPIDVIP